MREGNCETAQDLEGASKICERGSAPAKVDGRGCFTIPCRMTEETRRYKLQDVYELSGQADENSLAKYEDKDKSKADEVEEEEEDKEEDQLQ